MDEAIHGVYNTDNTFLRHFTRRHLCKGVRRILEALPSDNAVMVHVRIHNLFATSATALQPKYKTHARIVRRPPVFWLLQRAKQMCSGETPRLPVALLSYKHQLMLTSSKQTLILARHQAGSAVKPRHWICSVIFMIIIRVQNGH
jgi:hypothetical protein